MPALEHPPCADQCGLLAEALAQLARAKGVPDRSERIGWRLSPEYRPPLPRTTRSIDSRWFDEHDSTD